jgi:hypothetical protein
VSHVSETCGKMAAKSKAAMKVVEILNHDRVLKHHRFFLSNARSSPISVAFSTSSQIPTAGRSEDARS